MTLSLEPALDYETCDRARMARDPAYDGLFFTGVRTTRVYCRPVCPVRPAKSENVVFFPTAAAAERAGFRPCLRCRPETAPGSPAWRGTATTLAAIAFAAGFSSVRRFNDAFKKTYGRPPSAMRR